MGLKSLIKKNIKRMNYSLRTKNRYWKTSAGNMLLYSELKKILPKYAKGLTLDAGAGHLLYKEMLSKYPIQYESMDFMKTHPNLTYVTDIQNMKIVRSNRYQFLFCRNVLEHIPEPHSGFSEIARVLKKGGYAIITVPHLAYLHNEPHDYWRFTKYSLRFLAEQNKLSVISIKEIGGLISYKGYILQTLLLGMTFHIPVLNKIMLWINFLLQKIIIIFDKVFGMKKLFPLNYILVVKK